ncbi:hypothetical protein ACROYT_G005521 [Oculina patagonica]
MEEGLDGGNVGNEVQNEIEPLLSRNQPSYMHFRVGRQPQPASKCTRFVLPVFKVTFCSLALWGHQPWNYLPRVLLSAICIFQTAFVLSSDFGCPVFDCSVNRRLNDTATTGSEVDGKDSLKTVSAYRTLFSLAALVSYLLMIGCFIVAKSKLDSALVSPSASMMEDVQRKGALLLFVAFSFITVSLVGVSATFFKLASLLDGYKFSLTEAAVAAQFVALWASVNTCHVFAVSSFTIGTFAQDAFRLIRDVQNGTLDDVIRIHEDLCTVVFNTVSAYSVWFVVHWFTYGVGVVAAVIFMSELVFFWDKYPVFFKVTISFFLLCFFYVFILPCVCAARITSSCAVNCTTSNDWNEGHPFKDRRNISLFMSYAKDRRCGFKVGRITFNTSLAWFSLFLGLTALLFHFL